MTSGPMDRSRYGAAIAVLSAAGTVVSGYLSWYKLADTELWCAGIGGCDVVNASPYAELFGIPVALLGLVGYLALTSLGWLWWRQGAVVPTWVPLAAAGFSTLAWVYSAYLTYLEAFVIHAYCIWCLTSFALISGIWAVSLWGMQRYTG